MLRVGVVGPDWGIGADRVCGLASDAHWLASRPACRSFWAASAACFAVSNSPNGLKNDAYGKAN